MIERNLRPAAVGDALVNASRQMWLAGLGAAAVTRDWAEKEGTTAFRKLVREGTAMESRAVRIVGDRLETSYTQANTLWKRARRSMTTTVRAYADTAATLVRETLPASLPKVEIAIDSAPAARKRSIKRTRKGATATKATARKRIGRSSKAAKRTVKTGKRG